MTMAFQSAAVIGGNFVASINRFENTRVNSSLSDCAQKFSFPPQINSARSIRVFSISRGGCIFVPRLSRGVRWVSISSRITVQFSFISQVLVFRRFFKPLIPGAGLGPLRISFSKHPTFSSKFSIFHFVRGFLRREN